MTRPVQRVQLARGFVLHAQPYRDTSLMLHVFTRDHGRLLLFAGGVRGPRGTRARSALLQPFRPLLLSWHGRGDAGRLVAAEDADAAVSALAPARLMSAFYLNELLLKLLTREDPNPELFDQYAAAVQRLAAGEPLETVLRRFEARLLELIGYGLNWLVEADTGRAVEAQSQYHFQPGVHGFVRAEPGCTGAIDGWVLQQLVSDAPLDATALAQARGLLRQAIDQCLEGRALATRAVARSVGRVLADRSAGAGVADAPGQRSGE